MLGIPYKDTFAAKGSNLYAALIEGDMEKAKAIYTDTNQRYYDLLTPKETTCVTQQTKLATT